MRGDHFAPVYIPIVLESAPHSVEPEHEGCVSAGILSLHLIFLIVYNGRKTLLPSAVSAEAVFLSLSEHKVQELMDFPLCLKGAMTASFCKQLSYYLSLKIFMKADPLFDK